MPVSSSVSVAGPSGRCWSKGMSNRMVSPASSLRTASGISPAPNNGTSSPFATPDHLQATPSIERTYRG
jgi:hypothetical protein